MPYFVFRLRPFSAPQALAEFTAFAAASEHAKSLRAALAGQGPERIKIMFADNAQQAEDLLCEIREPRPAEDD